MVPGKTYGYRPCTCSNTACSCNGPIRVGEVTLTINAIQEREIADIIDRNMKSLRVKDWEQRLPRRRR